MIKLKTHIVASCFLFIARVLLPNSESLADDFSKTIKPFFREYCIKCHGAEKSKATVTFHNIDGNIIAGSDQARWEQVLDVLESGEMPPENETTQPTQTQRDQVAKWITSGLRESIKAERNSVEPTTTRRLTNFEYENTIRDLIGFKLKLIDNLPKDPVKPYAFNNTADLMQMGPEQIDRYLENARFIMASVIVDPAKPKSHKTRREWKPYGLDKGLAMDEIGPWGNRRNSPAWGMGLKSFPKTGEFRVRVKASAILPNGISEMPLRLIMGYGININSSTQQVEPVGTVRLRNTPDEPMVFEFRGRIENFPVQPSRAVKKRRVPESLTITPQNLYDDGSLNDQQLPLSMPRAVIEWMEFEAPIAEVWPPEHHTRILFESDLLKTNPQAYVRQVISRFVSRAYRRPATEIEVDQFVKIYELVSRELDSFEAAIRETLSMVLLSPDFLYHMSAENSNPSQYALASRLSYFLWGSMPDDQLLRLAAAGQLSDPSVIQQQVIRLLKDDRSHDFVNNFTSQWLSLAKLKTVPINQELFPRFLYYVPRGERAGTEEPYRPTIRDYMHQETVGFIAELIRRNASVLNVVDSDFAYLNQPLAVHYGVPGIEGDELRPVSIKPEHRLGGLLTQGSILIGNGTGSAPHPIYRAVWLREAILGDEVQPPPADVPALSDSAGESAETSLTIKDLLAQHRQKESCNDCHTRLDPWGIPFERYNAIGRFQEKVPKQGTRVSGFNKKLHNDSEGYEEYLRSINLISIDAQADLPRGPTVSGMVELKRHLLKDRKEDIARNLLRRLLSYGLGRGLTHHDRFAVEDMLKKSSETEYKLQDMIVLLCQSELFRGTGKE